MPRYTVYISHTVTIEQYWCTDIDAASHLEANTIMAMRFEEGDFDLDEFRKVDEVRPRTGGFQLHPDMTMTAIHQPDEKEE